MHLIKKVAFSAYKSFIFPCDAEAYWLISCVLNICNCISGCFIIEMPVVLWNVHGMSSQHSSDLQRIWIVPCFARTFHFYLKSFVVTPEHKTTTKSDTGKTEAPKEFGNECAAVQTRASGTRTVLLLKNLLTLCGVFSYSGWGSQL